MSIRKVNFAPGEFYHLYNRGANKMEIFKDWKDFDYIQKQRVTTIEKIKNEGFSNMPDLEDILKFLVTERNIKYEQYSSFM